MIPGSLMSLLMTGKKDFPVIKGVNSIVSSGNVASQTVSLPSTAVAGEIILLTVGGHGGAPAFLTPSGYTQIVGQMSSQICLHNFWKVASGGETSATVTYAASAAGPVTLAAHIITGASSCEAAQTYGGAGYPDSPSLSPSWGADNTLFFATVSQRGSSYGQSAPSGYGSFDQIVFPFGQDLPRMSWASRQSASVPEDPPAWGGICDNYWAAATIAVRP